MKRRLILNLLGLAPLTLIAAKIPNTNSLVATLIKRWKSSKTYTLAVLEAMPEGAIEYRPSEDQMSFAQHLMHLGFTNTMYIGILLDTTTYKDFDALKKADFLIWPPDDISLFQPDTLGERDLKTNKALVGKYIADTFDYVIAALDNVSDELLSKGEKKEKPWFLSGHNNLDLIIRGEQHTAHHRAQAIAYLRMNGVQPPGYSKHNIF